LFFLAPLLLGIALAIKISSRGPVLDRRLRVGSDRRVFYIYKFRSTRAPRRGGGDQHAGAFDYLPPADLMSRYVAGEGRHTAIGRLLRFTALDELPQFINVLRGDMSFVGPRPKLLGFAEP